MEGEGWEAKLNSHRRSASGWALSVWLACLALGAAPLPGAAHAAQKPASAPRLLPAKEGRGIVKVAWKHRERVRRRPDCSHLVHQIYGLAGFAYPYATSFHLYAGTENFVRIKKPQPGDLVVWRGHVGIVVDPGERSFYSSLNSGLRVTSYDSRYWRRRGPARFYRYAPGGAGRLLVAAATSPTAKTAAARPAFEIPSNILIVAAAAQPTREEVAEAISELTNAAGHILRRQDILHPAQPVVIFDEIQVRRVKTNSKKGRGQARVQVVSRVTIAKGKIKRKRRSEKRRWELRRTESGWLAFTPQERIYVPRAVAVRVLAEQLETLTRNDYPASDPAKLARQQVQLAQLASLLNALLEKK